MTATVADNLQVALPLDVCAELGIQPGVKLDFRARNGRLEAVKIPENNFASIYTPERDAEEAVIQKACSCEVPDDFPQ